MTSRYVFTPGEAELARLRALESLLDAGTIEVLEGRVGVREGMRVLEVGAGAGSIVRWLSTAVGPAGCVVATDLDLRHIDRADLAENVDLRRHDICRDPVDPHSFDVVHARYVLEHLQHRDAAVAAMVSALRPGGHLVIETSDPVTAWLGLLEQPGVRALRDAFDRVFDDAGGDSYLGRNLPTTLARHGLLDIAGCAHAELLPSWRDPAAAAYRLSVDKVAARMVSSDLLSQAEIDAALAVLNAHDVPFLNHLTITVWGRRK